MDSDLTSTRISSKLHYQIDTLREHGIEIPFRANCDFARRNPRDQCNFVTEEEASLTKISPDLTGFIFV